MEKKGFTLIEIIISITLLSLIVVVIIVGVNLSKDDDKSKIKEKIISVADVYFSTNEELLYELNDNYGYYVVDIKTLKELGLLDENYKVPELSDDERGSDKGYTYDKLLIKYGDEDISSIDYVYPYEKNSPFIANLDPLVLEEGEVFRCNTDLDSIDYLDEDYVKSNSTNFECSNKELLFDENNIPVGIKDGVSKNEEVTLSIGENWIWYKVYLDDDTIRYGVREVILNPGYNPLFVVKLYDTDEEYTCSEWTNKNVLMKFIEKDESGNEVIRTHNNLSFSWERDDNTIDGEISSFLNVDESGVYNGSYNLKSTMNGKTIKEGTETCEIKIDKNKPKIEMDVSSDELNINIIDDKSGVYGYLVSKQEKDITKLTKEDFNIGTTTKFNTNSLEKYYIYAIDNAGNIASDLYGESNYPSITYEAIDGSFSKFKVTVKDISGNNYDISDIKVQYTYNNTKYNFYDNGYNPGINNGGHLTTFKNNFSYNNIYDSSKANYIDYSTKVGDNVCNETECTFVIDMEDAIKGCAGNYYCKRIVEADNLNNLSLDYYVYAKNNKGYYREMKINSILNVYENEDEFGGFFRGDRTNSKLIGSNSNGDIVYYTSYITDDTYTYYNNATGDVYTFYEDDSKITLTSFTNDKITYNICSTSYICTVYSCNDWEKVYYRKYTEYEYNLNTNKTTKLQTKTDYGYTNCTFNSNVSPSTYSSTKYNTLSNYEFLSRFLGGLYDWESASVTNPTTHFLDKGIVSDNILKDYIFYRNKDGVTWNSVFSETIFKSSSDSGSSTFYTKGKLFFLTEVSLSTLDNKIGK